MSADNSYEARIKRLRERTLAVFHARNPTAPEAGRAILDESTRTSRRVGQMRVVIQPPEGPAYEVAPCCPSSEEECLPVCPVSTSEENTPEAFIVPTDTLSLQAFQEEIDSIYGISTPIPDEPIGYELDFFYVLFYPPYCNSTSQTVQVQDNVGNIPSQITDLGPSLFADPPLGGVVIIYPSRDDGTLTLSLTVSNSCSSSTGNAQFFCFLAGSPVTMEDGSTKPIETVAVGDRVVGAFGEINTVTGTLSNNLGFVPITNINGEHKTTAPHPHITSDHKLCCTDPTSLNMAYGRNFPLKGADGRREARVIKGVNPERITKLEVGTILQTQTGPRAVTTLETIRMPASTRVYHLTTDGSHSYLVDGYAVAGGATEDDFDYDSWTPRVN